jgi:hypothetical protein
VYVQVFQIGDKGTAGVANVEAGIRRIFVETDHQIHNNILSGERNDTDRRVKARTVPPIIHPSSPCSKDPKCHQK